MCGITAVFKRKSSELRGDSTGTNDVLNLMINAVRHRGPDQLSQQGDDNSGLGVARLMILGGVAGTQPFSTSDGQISSICNGEIYNHQELRSLLFAHGFAMETRSDCEIIPHLYSLLGESFVERLQGQFAFILWDRAQNKVIVGRDRFGICPLFWYFSDNELLLASEIKALLSTGCIAQDLDMLGIAETALLYAPIPPRTCFKNVWQLSPASYAVFDLNSWQVRHTKYWRPPLLSQESSPFLIDPKDERKYVATLRELLYEANKRRLQGETPFGTYLSGGIDSSAIAYLTSLTSPKEFESFSISFVDGRFDESHFQEIVADRLAITRNTLRCTNTEIEENLIATVWHAESPLFRTAAVPMYLLSKMVHSKGCKFILSGEGADELFCGYPIFDKSTWINTNKEYGPLFISHVSRWQHSRRLLQLLSPDCDPPTLFRAALDELAAVLDVGYEPTPLARAQQIEITTKLSGYLLAAQGDRVAMAHAVEPRFPFLDEDLVAFALQLPESMKLRNKENKYLLREAFKDALPNTITSRAKQGYLAPNDAPLGGKGGPSEILIDLLSNSKIYENPHINHSTACDLRDRSIKNQLSDAEQIDLVFVLTMQIMRELFLMG